MPIIQVKPAGTALSRVEKYAEETIVYRLECSALLEPMELISTAVAIDVPEGVKILNARTREGISIEVTITNEDLLSQVYQDYLINISYKTTLGNTRIAAFQLRVYK